MFINTVHEEIISILGLLKNSHELFTRQKLMKEDEESVIKCCASDILGILPLYSLVLLMSLKVGITPILQMQNVSREVK